MSDYTWDETKKILDDPYVSADTKQAVLHQYRKFGDDNEAAEAYYEKYNVRTPYPGLYRDEDWNYYQAFDGLKDPYEKAREESEEGSYRSDQLESKLDENADELDQAQPPGSSSSSAGGVTTSDELLELAKDALDTFHTFLPIDAQVPADSKHIDGPLDYATDIRERYWEQSGIDFRKFLDDAEQLRKAHGTLKELRTSTQQDLNSLYRDWTGDAANASYQQYSEDIAPNAADLIEHLDGASQVIEAAVQTVFDTVKHKAEQVMQLYTPTVGQATPEIAKQVMTLANGDFSTQDEVLEVAAWVDSVCGSNLEATIRADSCGLNDENKELVKTECKTWIRESWNVDLYDNLYASFTSLCDSTKEAVDQAYSTLNEYLGEYENGFPAQQGGTPGGTQPPGVDTGVGTPGAGTPGAGTAGVGTPGAGAGTPSVPTPGVGSPGGGSPGGGSPGGGSSGAPTTPSTPTPEVPTPEAPKAPEFETPGPGTGGPGTGGGDTGGDGKPDMPRFETPDLKRPDLGLDDGEGNPDNLLNSPGDDRDRLTVEEGDNTLEITEPDDDGKMEISVDDGTGLPKDYRLDFGNDDAAGDDAAGNGAAGNGAAGNGAAGDGNASGDTGDRREVRAEDSAEAYDGGSDGGADGGKVHTPGPDGTIRIEDGDLTIVAEQPEGPDGPTLVTVDDGTGEPTTYTLDGVDSGDSGDSGADSGLRTLPKEFEPPSSGSLDLDDGPAGGDDPAGGGGAAVGGGVTGGGGSVGEGAGSIGAGAGSVGGGGGGGFSADSEAPQPLNEGSRTSATTGALPTSGAPAAAAGGGDAGGGAAGGRGGMMGGGMMGAPMGAGGGAGGQGGDQERTSSYRIDGGLFDGSESPQAITGTIGDDPPAVRYDK